MARGSYNTGSRHPRARLTEQKVLDARRRHAKGESASALAAELGVTRSTMNDALNGRNWAHVEMPGEDA